MLDLNIWLKSISVEEVTSELETKVRSILVLWLCSSSRPLELEITWYNRAKLFGAFFVILLFCHPVFDPVLITGKETMLPRLSARSHTD